MMIPISESVGALIPYVHHSKHTSSLVPSINSTKYDISGSFVESRYSTPPSILNVRSTNFPIKSKYVTTNISNHSVLYQGFNKNETIVLNGSNALNETKNIGSDTKTSTATALSPIFSIMQLLIGCAYHLE